jgi:protein-disulfide isomerase
MRHLVIALSSALVLSCSASDRPTTATTTTSAEALAAPAPSPTSEPRFAVPIDGLPIMGDGNALVTIVEFTDYECPYCAKAEKTMRELRDAYGRDLRFAVAMHPLPMHPHARDAALVALASTHFEETHAHLFEIGGVADPNAARAPFESLANAEQLGAKLRVRGTPTFFINGKRVTGAQPYATFDKMVSHELATARGLVASGTRPSRVYDALLDEARANPAPLPEDDDAPKLVPAAVGMTGLPFLGRDDAAKTIVLFTDLECPYCKRLDARLREFTKTHDDVRVVFRNHPLPMHPHARLAAKAAIAASAQNGLAHFVEIVFAHQDALDRAKLVAYASQAGLDVPRFTRDLDSDETAHALAEDEALGNKLDVKGTPSSFVEGKLVVGAQPLTTFEEALH